MSDCHDKPGFTRRRFLGLLGAATGAGVLGANGLFGCERDASFDYIVVGAGSAGCPLVARLLSIPSATVLLIEAGGTNQREDIRDFTQAWKLTQPNSDVDWGFKSQGQPALNGKPQSYSSGKVLGGTSSINGMVWVRGHRGDFDRWREEGCAGWDYESVLPSFKNLETYLAGDPAYRGRRGPVFTSDELTSRNELAKAMRDGAIESGYARNDDYNAREQKGSGFGQLNVTPDGSRQDAFTAFVKPHLDDPRLTVMTGARAKRILFDSFRKADRVVLDTGGREVTVRARREIVLCTGTIHTPHLLMLSGIGDPAELKSFGIDVVAGVPGVGKNLQDHLISVAVRELSHAPADSHITTMDVCTFAGDSRHGPPGAPKFEVQSYYIRYGWGSYPVNSLALGSIHLHPVSRGTVKLASPDVRTAPIIDPNLLGAPEDVAAQLEGYKMIRRILAAQALSGWVKPVEHTPGPDVKDDAQLLEAMRQYSEVDFHPVGTCKMGVDTAAVVDPLLRVRGVRGLRVAGAAVMPYVTSGNTNAPSMMIGDRGGELIAKGA